MPADRFAKECAGISGATVVETDGPIHVYDGVLTGGERCRILTLAPEQTDNDDAMAAFTQAAQRWGSISHNPYIGTVYESDDRPRPWLAYDAGDRPLVDAIDDLDRDERLRVLDSVFEGFDTASLYNVSHTALAPDCIVLSDDGDSVTADLTDWGLTRDIKTALGDQTVTPYTAPEQLDDDTAPTTEVYRVGMVAYWLLTGHEPYADAEDLEQAVREGDLQPPSEVTDLPASLDEIIATATATDPADRYDDVADLREAIRVAFD